MEPELIFPKLAKRRSLLNLLQCSMFIAIQLNDCDDTITHCDPSFSALLTAWGWLVVRSIVSSTCGT